MWVTLPFYLRSMYISVDNFRAAGKEAEGLYPRFRQVMLPTHILPLDDFHGHISTPTFGFAPGTADLQQDPRFQPLEMQVKETVSLPPHPHLNVSST